MNIFALRFVSPSKLVIKILMVILMAGLVSACQKIPIREFNTYKNNFNEAREAAETVILDFAAVQKKISDERAKRTATRKGAIPLRDQPFDIEKIIANANPVDHAAIRFHAWEVVARYNDVLTALIEGKRAEKVTAATEGLVESMGSFPVKGFKDAAASITPALGIITTALTEIQKVYDRKKALKAIVSVSPEIQKGLISSMIADVKDYNEVNRARYDKRITNAGFEISKAKKAFRKLAYSGKATEALNKMVVGINELLSDPSIKAAKVSPLKLDNDKFLGGSNTGQLTQSQLGDLESRIEAGVVSIKAVDREVADYRELLGEYVILLNKISQSLGELVQAVKMNKSFSPDSFELLYAAIRVKRAYIAYRQIK